MSNAWKQQWRLRVADYVIPGQVQLPIGYDLIHINLIASGEKALLFPNNVFSASRGGGERHTLLA